jgi:group I intron endonuclease
MLLLNFIILVMTIPLASNYLSTILIHRSTFLIVLIITLGGLFQTTLLSQSCLYHADYISLLYNAHNTSLLLIPITYLNSDVNKLEILTNNKNRSGIYQWIHKDSGKTYVGSAYNLSQRIGQYFSIKYLMYHKNSHIYKALLKYGYSNFNLSILEYVDGQNLSKEDIKILLLEKEQMYINTLKPDFNILKIAGSPLGRRLSKNARDLLSKSRKGKYDGIHNPMFGRIHSLETKLSLSSINTGINNPMFGRTGDNNILSKKVYIYEKDNLTNLFKEFSSYTEAANFFECHRKTIYRYIDKNIYYKNKWIISSTLITSS